MKVLFITLNSVDAYAGIPKWRYSLASAYLQSFYTLSKFYPETYFVNVAGYENTQDQELLNIIGKEKPSLVVFSCYVWNTAKIIGLLPKIKSSFPDIQIIVGGPECTYDFVELLDSQPYIDILVKGPGEITFSKVLDNFHKGNRGLDTIKGIIYYDKGQNKFIETPDAKPIENIDNIPSPYLNSTIDLKALSRSIVGIETQRGCAYRCRYCNYFKGSKRIRYFDLKRVKRELSLILKYRPRQLYLMDPVFNSNKKRAKEILKHIAGKNSDRKVTINTEVLLDTMDRQTFDLMKKAGVKTVEVGIQSFNNKAVKIMNRYRDEAALLKNMKYGIDCGLNLVPQIIFGLPGDTIDDFYKSFDKMYDFNVGEIDIFHLSILPGTEFRINAQRYGIKYEKSPPYRVLSNNSLTRQQINHLVWFRKLVLCSAWFKKTIVQICREKKTSYHALFNGFLEQNRNQLDKDTFNWPIQTTKDRDNAIKAVEMFAGYLEESTKPLGVDRKHYLEEIKKSKESTKRILIFRYLSVSKKTLLNN